MPAELWGCLGIHEWTLCKMPLPFFQSPNVVAALLIRRAYYYASMLSSRFSFGIEFFNF